MATRLQKNVKQCFKDNIGIIGVLLILCIFLSVFPKTNDSFLTQKDIFNVLRQVSSNLFLAYGMTMVTILGSIDLLVGSIIALLGCFTVDCMPRYDLPIAVGVLGGVLVGTVADMFDDVIIPKATMPPFIITLATMNVAKGLAYVCTGGSPVRMVTEGWQLLGARCAGGIPTPVILLAVVLIITAIIMSKTKLGCRICAVSDNSRAARLSGISTAKVKLLIHTYSGIMAGLAGVVLTSRTYSGQPTARDGTEMDTVAAVVVGDTSMAGSSGEIGSTIIDGLIIDVLNNGLSLLNVNSFQQYAVKRIVILLTVLTDYLRNKETEWSLAYNKNVSRQQGTFCRSQNFMKSSYEILQIYVFEVQ